MPQLFLLLCLFATSCLHAQYQLSGRISDAYTGAPISGADISLSLDGIVMVSGSSEENGVYSISVPEGGRYELTIIATGYQSLSLPGYLVGSGPRAGINWTLEPRPSVELDAVTVRSTPIVVDPLARSVQLEEVRRLPATFYDPARLLSLSSGVVQSNDQANHLSVRGNSPNRNLWRIQGLAIINPNHTSNAGTITDNPSFSGGGVNALSAQLLDNSVFYAGSLPVEYGNALGGTFDMQLRPGSNQGPRHQVQAGLIGIDLATEGPLGKGAFAPSYLVNYRYSFTGLLGDLGVDFGGEEIRFQDFSLHLFQPLASGGSVSLFGLYADSRNEFTGPEMREEVEEEKDLLNIDYDGNSTVIGGKWEQPLGKGRFSLGAAYSATEQSRLELTGAASPASGLILGDQILEQERISANTQYSWALTPASQLKVGAEFLAESAENVSVTFNGRSDYAATVTSPYLSFDHRSEKWRYTLGLRYSLYDGEDLTNRFEPRLRISHFRGKETLTLGLEAISQLSAFGLLANEAGGTTVDNLYGYRGEVAWSFRNNRRALWRVGSFFQLTPDDYGFRTAAATFVPGNSLLEMPNALTFAGGVSSRSYGLEVAYELPISGDDFYYSLNASIFNSDYRGDDDNDQIGTEWQSGRYDYGFSFRGVAGKEWSGTDKKDRKRTLGLNLAVLVNGGEWQQPIDEEASRDLLTTVYLARSGFTQQNALYFRPDLRLYKRKYRAKTTTTLALDIQNLASVTNDAYRYYDTFLDAITLREQLTLIPVLSYRLEWKGR